MTAVEQEMHFTMAQVAKVKGHISTSVWTMDAVFASIDKGLSMSPPLSEWQ